MRILLSVFLMVLVTAFVGPNMAIAEDRDPVIVLQQLERTAAEDARRCFPMEMADREKRAGKALRAALAALENGDQDRFGKAVKAAKDVFNEAYQARPKPRTPWYVVERQLPAQQVFMGQAGTGPGKGGLTVPNAFALLKDTDVTSLTPVVATSVPIR